MFNSAFARSGLSEQQQVMAEVMADITGGNHMRGQRPHGAIMDEVAGQGMSDASGQPNSMDYNPARPDSVIPVSLFELSPTKGMRQVPPSMPVFPNHPIHSRFEIRPSDRNSMSEKGDFASVNLFGLKESFSHAAGGSNIHMSYANECVYNSNEMRLKLENPYNASPEKSREEDPGRSVSAILAASEAIKHQDVASEVEIGTMEVEVKPDPNKDKTVMEDKKSDIDDDIEQIRKAAKSFANTLKVMSKDSTEEVKSKKPKLKMTFTKKSRINDAHSQASSVYITNTKGDSTGTNNQAVHRCDFCDKNFKKRDRLNQHIKIHTGKKNYRCSFCGTEFGRSEHLRRHERKHTGERPYECGECGKTFMRNEHLKRHHFVHTGEKPFQCPVCDKSFPRHDRLIKHSLIHDQ
ncbi:hypothetical protein CHS0354_033718 [Potamilus streckersoni]|uniref:C2H2-type domain-containing protein n=1 Tax=Potamilus streckersoni TaxID=2493646 RepID=A0AAE0VN22_9BIVA|nr:hypothetical protein CHS0354_033718 [Potamilus streckersoni]